MNQSLPPNLPELQAEAKNAAKKPQTKEGSAVRDPGKG